MEIQKFEYLKNEKSFLDEIKSIFIVFKGLSYGVKIKIDKKCGGTSFEKSNEEKTTSMEKVVTSFNVGKVCNENKVSLSKGGLRVTF